MPHPVKASLVAEDEDQQTRSELEAYQEREHARRERAAVIRMVKEDMQSRKRMPDVSEPTTYELGEDGEIPVIVDPKDEDGIVKVSLDTTGDGEIDAILCFDKKKKLRDIGCPALAGIDLSYMPYKGNYNAFRKWRRSVSGRRLLLKNVCTGPEHPPVRKRRHGISLQVINRHQGRMASLASESLFEDRS